MEKVFYWLSIVGSICSSLGIGLLTFFSREGQNSNLANIAFSIAIIVLLISVIYLALLSSNKNKIISNQQKLINGYKVIYSERGQKSTSIARTAIRSIDIFAGDLTWLEKDIPIYSELIRTKNITVRILTDNNNASVIPMAKEAGIEFKQYPNSKKTPLIASLFDGNSDSEARVLVINKCSLRPNEKGDNYNYWFKEYYGENDKIAIKSFTMLFEHYYFNGDLI